MSDISSVDRVFDATPEHFDQDEYKRLLTTDPQYSLGSFPVQRIQWLQDEGRGVFSTWSVDSTIQIKAPSDAFRNHQASLWQKVQAEETAQAREGTIFGLGAITIALCLKAFDHQKNGPISALVFLVGGIASLIFTSMKWNHANAAAKQVTGWNKSPVETLANQRAEACKNGFPYAYSNHLKLEEQGSTHGILHPLEVKTMYEKYFPGFCRELLSREENHDKGREGWMHTFLSMNPLSANLMNYGLGYIPENMKAVCEDYKHFNSILESVKNSFSDLKQQIRENSDKLIASYEDQRKAALQPWIEKKTTALNNARNVRDAIFKEFPLKTSKEHQNAEATFKTLNKLYENDYKQNVAPIHQYFDQKIEEVKKGREESLKSFDGQQTHQLLNYYSIARELLGRAESAWNGQSYQPVNFKQYFHWQVPQPVAPPPPLFYNPVMGP